LLELLLLLLLLLSAELNEMVLAFELGVVVIDVVAKAAGDCDGGGEELFVVNVGNVTDDEDAVAVAAAFAELFTTFVSDTEDNGGDDWVIFITVL
jgi:hypothetical protein